MGAGGKVHNCDDAGEEVHGVWCSHCGNTGVVVLTGTVTIRGHTTSRGATCCKWCDMGTRRYAQWTRPTGLQKGHDAAGKVHVHFHRQILPASDYTLHDVELEHAEGRRQEAFIPDAEWLLEREAHGVPRRALMLVAPRRSWPSSWGGDPGDMLDPVEPTTRRNDR